MGFFYSCTVFLCQGDACTSFSELNANHLLIMRHYICEAVVMNLFMIFYFPDYLNLQLQSIHKKLLARTLFLCLFDFTNLRENKALANKKCFTIFVRCKHVDLIFIRFLTQLEETLNLHSMNNYRPRINWIPLKALSTKQWLLHFHTRDMLLQYSRNNVFL